MKKTAILITGTLKMTPPGTVDPPVKMVFQRVRAGLGNAGKFGSMDVQLRQHVIPADPKTAAQIARRDLMRAAVARYRAMTGIDLDPFKKTAEKRRISVFNAVVSDTLKNYHLSGGVLTPNP